LLFGVQRQQISREMRRLIKTRVPDSQLVLLGIAKELERNPGTRFKRMHEREFRLDGRMYDVVRKESRGDTTWYHCIEDEKETALFARLDEMIRDEMNGDSERNRQAADLLRLCSSPYLGAPSARAAVVPPVFEAPADAPERIRNLYIIPPTPPPRNPV